MTERQLELGAALEDDEDQHCHQHDACRYCEKLGRDPRDPRATEPRPPGNRASTAFLLLEILELLPALRALPQMGFQRDTLRQSCAPALVGGASVLAGTGLATRFVRFETDGGVARGRVVQVNNGMGVDGLVIVSARPRNPDDGRPEIIREAQAVGGDFAIELGLGNEGGRFQGHYLGRYPWMPSDSEVVAL